MELKHNKKTKGSNSVIPLHFEKAVLPSAFATYTKKLRGGIEHDVFGWRMESIATEGQYVGHSFELMIAPTEVDRLIEALQTAKARFAVQEIPSGVEKIEVEEEKESDGE